MFLSLLKSVRDKRFLLLTVKVLLIQTHREVRHGWSRNVTGPKNTTSSLNNQLLKMRINAFWECDPIPTSELEIFHEAANERSICRRERIARKCFSVNRNVLIFATICISSEAISLINFFSDANFAISPRRAFFHSWPRERAREPWTFSDLRNS